MSGWQLVGTGTRAEIVRVVSSYGKTRRESLAREHACAFYSVVTSVGIKTFGWRRETYARFALLPNGDLGTCVAGQAPPFETMIELATVWHRLRTALAARGAR